MPGTGYFLRLGGVLALGLVALVLAAILLFILLPYIFVIAVSALVMLAAFIIIWAVIYTALIAGAAIYYLFRPMNVEKKDSGYTLGSAKEAGMRQKGRGRKKGRS